MKKPLLIAYYLTQFHPIPENDAWWGKGFTEWTNVTKAAPLFNGHYQPHLPADLGFYDLRVRETRRQQIDLAKQYGIDGFCYYYYWFSGKKLLEAPLEDMLADKQSSMPFMLMWANENWTRRWDGLNSDVLISQGYAPEDDLKFITSVLPYLKDERYIRLDGAPILAVYRPQLLPDARRTLKVWRDYCASQGIERLHLAGVYGNFNWDHASYGFDSGIEFPPNNLSIRKNTLDHLLHFFTKDPFDVADFADVANQFLERRYGGGNRAFRCVFPAWDNSPRKSKNGLVVLNGTPANYEWWLAQAIGRTESEFPGRDSIVFINAWNEWAEGAHLEPDRKHGRAFLEATLRARNGSTLKGWTHTGVPKDFHVLEPRNVYHRTARPAPILTQEQLAASGKNYLRK